jgi:hypothetical protein
MYEDPYFIPADRSIYAGTDSPDAPPPGTIQWRRADEIFNG